VYKLGISPLGVEDYLSTHQINESHSFLECTVDVTNVNTKEGSGRKRVDEKLNNKTKQKSMEGWVKIYIQRTRQNYLLERVFNCLRHACA
jgi:hypothetical protein